jgi:hypothetical protein
MRRHPHDPPDLDQVMKAARRQRAEFATALLRRAWAARPIGLLSFVFAAPTAPVESRAPSSPPPISRRA